MIGDFSAKSKTFYVMMQLFLKDLKLTLSPHSDQRATGYQTADTWILLVIFFLWIDIIFISQPILIIESKVHSLAPNIQMSSPYSI